MSSYYFRSGLSERLKALYRLQPKTYYVYILEIPEDRATKIGRTKRLGFRLRNLKAGIYRDHIIIHLIRCHGAAESLALEKHIHRTFAPRKIIREWFSGVSLDEIQALLVNEYAHLALEPYLDEHHKPYYHVPPNTPLSQVSFDVSFSTS